MKPETPVKVRKYSGADSSASALPPTFMHRGLELDTVRYVTAHTAFSRIFAAPNSEHSGLAGALTEAVALWYSCSVRGFISHTNCSGRSLIGIAGEEVLIPESSERLVETTFGMLACWRIASATTTFEGYYSGDVSFEKRVRYYGLNVGRFERLISGDAILTPDFAAAYDVVEMREKSEPPSEYPLPRKR